MLPAAGDGICASDDLHDGADLTGLPVPAQGLGQLGGLLQHGIQFALLAAHQQAQGGLRVTDHQAAAVRGVDTEKS
ncbi:MAG: hypothetical protein ACPHCJ_08880 [Oceanococcaceae bacterium]